jgi:2-methylcitrate dehydratase PrpD
MSTIAAGFAHGLFALAQKPLSPEVAREAKRSFINVVGTSVGACAHPGVDAILAAARDLGVAELAPVPGRTEKVDVYFSALATGFAGHLDDFDDTHLATVIHPAASILAVGREGPRCVRARLRIAVACGRLDLAGTLRSRLAHHRHLRCDRLRGDGSTAAGPG